MSEKTYTYFQLPDGRILTALDCMNWLRDQEVDEEDPEGILITPVRLTKYEFKNLPNQG